MENLTTENFCRLIQPKLFLLHRWKIFWQQLWIDPDFTKEKVRIKAVLSSNPRCIKSLHLYKKKPNADKLKSVDEL